MFKCKFIIVLYDECAQRNLKITYNNNRTHYREFFYNRTSKQQNNRADL